VAQVLGDDEVGPELADQLLVDRVERPAREDGVANGLVDVAARERRGVDARGRDDGQPVDVSREVALGGAADEPVPPAKGADDLGGAGEQ